MNTTMMDRRRFLFLMTAGALCPTSAFTPSVRTAKRDLEMTLGPMQMVSDERIAALWAGDISRYLDCRLEEMLDRCILEGFDDEKQQRSLSALRPSLGESLVHRQRPLGAVPVLRREPLHSRRAFLAEFRSEAFRFEDSETTTRQGEDQCLVTNTTSSTDSASSEASIASR